jgi:hypothetical protein
MGSEVLLYPVGQPGQGGQGSAALLAACQGVLSNSVSACWYACQGGLKVIIEV